MYVIAICGPIGADLNHLAKQISAAIKSKSVSIVTEDKLMNEKGEYAVQDLAERIEKEQGVLICVGHFMFNKNALDEAFAAGLNPKKAECSTPSVTGKEPQVIPGKTKVINLQIFLETDSDTCYKNYLQAKLDKTSINLTEILQINEEYELSIKPKNDDIINPSRKYAHVKVHEAGDHAVLCSLINSAVNPVPVNSTANPVPDQEQNLEPTAHRFFS
ncbi:hypothetical protein [Legionella erythra]|uniref:Uridine/cytidine kinase n=1 Tax=Legionella erythra TaxID=448 RepID=A0A0W0TF15_LEGER|nr:hypothetical protein [Legionella erythra]KTC94144.1 uridine/cytidine kinase [Legionella erythra]